MNKNITILYVDDESINTMIFEINIKKYYNVITTESGFKGIEILKSNPKINIVISDMKMPGMNGLEFILLAKKDFPQIAYFILTGYDITEEISNALSSKLILKYFRKPFDINEIKEAIENAFI